MSWKVLITARVFTQVGQPALEALRNAGCEVVLPEAFGPWTDADLTARIAGIDATLCSPDQYSAAVLNSPAAASMKVISRWGVGYDSIDIAEATRQGIVVAYTPGLLNEAVADWTWALLLGIARRVPQGHIAVANGGWVHHWGHDVARKRLGIIGCGRIGQAVARRASGFDMEVVGFDSQLIQPPGIRMVALEELLATSDFVSVHAALTPESRGLINAARLRLMKPSAYLINTSRGPLIDEAALAQALHEGRIAGAALDVFSKEPLPADNPLRGAPNLVLTPHQASFARETGEAVSMAAAQAILALMRGERARWVVDESVYQRPNLRVTMRA